MPTILLEDLQQANEDELRQHLNDLLNPPSPPPEPSPPAPDPDLMAHLGGGPAAASSASSVPQELADHVDQLLSHPSPPPNVSPQPAPSPPTPSDTLTNPIGTGNRPQQAPPPQELADHVDQLLAPPSQTTPAPDTSTPPSVVQDLGDRAGGLASRGLHVLGQGVINLGLGAQQAAQQATSGVINLVSPTPSPAATPRSDASVSQPTTAAGTQAPSGAIDASSPAAFARSVAPYAQYAAQQLGIDPTWVTAMMASESNYGKAPGNELFGVKALPGQKSQTLLTHEGEYGGQQMNQSFAAYDTPLDSVNAWVDLIKNHYQG
ncbi:MAG TPA: glucosaminidase domain-containing protein, partial [Chloroflexota bacterium]